MATEYRLRIVSDLTPDTFPMARLADYLASLAKLLGHSTNVHFKDVTAGSTSVAVRVDDIALSEVTERVHEVANGFGPQDALRAFADIDKMLRQDNATATLASEAVGVVIPFPGKDRPAPLTFGPFKQDGTIDGQVIRVGGKDNTVPVHLRDIDTIHTHLNATPELARRIAQHLLGPTVRVYGIGTWFRSGDGVWELRSFEITHFDVLEDAPLSEVVRQARNVSNSGWNEVPDPIRSLLDQRRDEGELQ